MSKTPVSTLEGRVERWWALFGAALFLLVPVDLLTTLFAVARHGLAVESNPFVRWLLGRGLLEVTLANLAAAVLAVLLFHAAVVTLRGSLPSPRHPVVYGVDAWVGLVFLAGVVVTANNVLVLV